MFYGHGLSAAMARFATMFIAGSWLQCVMKKSLITRPEDRDKMGDDRPGGKIVEIARERYILKEREREE